jgi:hypothetical protein
MTEFYGYMKMARICKKCKKRKPLRGGKVYGVAGKFICKECKNVEATV